ncbi:unnamed protein product [Urochloa decumbens]|uniref:DUF295 domain-containing protein n=1 Tax=Urochloa decumbens TaxID=240449 RepID=A0ABC8ZIF8_9POAL
MSSSKLSSRPHVQWCDIPVDPATDIIKSLDAIDVQNFSATCKQWAKICKYINATCLKSGRPMLLTSQQDQDGNRFEDDVKTGKFGIHDVSSKLSFICMRIGMQRRCWIGGKDDWLVTTNRNFEVELLNPITGASVPIPSFNINQADMRVNQCPGMKVNDCPTLSVTLDPFTRFFRRVVLSRTPAHHDGYEAIAIFSDGLLAYTSVVDSGWRVLKNPTDHVDGDMNYYPVDFHDAVAFNGRVLAVAEHGSIFAWDMNSNDLTPIQLPEPQLWISEDSKRRMFYLAISPTGRLMLLCMSGHGSGYVDDSMRMVWKPNARFEHVDAMTIQEFVEENEEWRILSSIGRDQCLFVGLNYPFYVNSNGLKANTVYVADVANNDMVMCSMKPGGGDGITKQNFPVDEAHRLVDGYSVRTPMWFRPTDPGCPRI